MSTGINGVVTPDQAGARDKLTTARRTRAEHLLAVTEGLLSVNDVIEAACTHHGAPLRRLSLRQLLLAQPGVGESAVKTYLADLRAVTQVDDEADLTIAWLVDSRAAHRRLLAWIDLQVRDTRLAPGFPFAALAPEVSR